MKTRNEAAQGASAKTTLLRVGRHLIVIVVFELRSYRFQPELLDGPDIELQAHAVAQGSEHLAHLVLLKNDPLADIGREARIALDEEPIYDSAIMRDYVPDRGALAFVSRRDDERTG